MSDSRAQLSSPEQREAAEARRRALILRYSAGVRTNHWLVAIAFFLAALSGLALFHPALFWAERPVRRRTLDAGPAPVSRAADAARFSDPGGRSGGR